MIDFAFLQNIGFYMSLRQYRAYIRETVYTTTHKRHRSYRRWLLRCINRRFSCVTKYRKMMFLSTWSRTNPFVATRGYASNLNGRKCSIPITKVEKHCINDRITRFLV